MTTADILAELPRLTAADLARVRAAIGELAADAPPPPLAMHPAVGMWKDRRDLPDDAIEASRLLRHRMMSGNDAADGPATA